MYSVVELIQQIEYLIGSIDRDQNARQTSKEIQTLNQNFSHLYRRIGELLPYHSRNLGHFGTAQSCIAQAMLRVGSDDLYTTKSELRKAKSALMAADLKLKQALT